MSGDMDRIVLRYLRAQGYSEACSLLEDDILKKKRGAGAAPVATAQNPTPAAEEADSRRPSVASVASSEASTSKAAAEVASAIIAAGDASEKNGGKRSGGSQTEILYWGVFEECPASIVEGYSALDDFVTGSLDFYKMELSTVLFPVFANMYLALTSRYLLKEAGGMMSRWGASHAEHYKEEVAWLRMVTSPEHIDASEYSQRLLRHRFVVPLCTVAYELLNAYMASAGNLPVICILNRHVSFRVEDRPPKGEFLIVHCCDVDSISKEENPAFQTELEWGSLPPSNVAAYAEMKKKLGQSPADAGVAAKGGTADKDKPKDEGASAMEISEPAANGSATADASAAPHPLERSKAEGGEVDVGSPMELESLTQAVPPNPPPLPSLESSWQQSILQRLWLRPLGSLTAISAAESYVKVGGAAGTVQEPFISDVRRPSVLLATLLNTHGQATCVQQTEDGARLAAAFQDRCIRVWDTRDMHGDSGSKAADSSSRKILRLWGHSRPVYSLSWAPDMRFLLSGGGDGGIRLWDLKQSSPQAVVVYQGHCSPVWAVSFSPVGYYFASGANDRTARLWSTDSVRPLRMFVGHLGDVSCTAFHPNCAYVASGSSDKTARLWDVRSGSCVRLLSGATAGLSDIAVSPTGRYVAAGSDDSDVRVWDVASGRQVAILRGHSGPVECVGFSAEGGVIASGGKDCTVRLWDIDKVVSTSLPHVQVARKKTEQHHGPIQTFYTKDTPVLSVRFTDRNLLLAAGPFTI